MDPERRSSGRRRVKAVTRFDVAEAREEQAVKQAILASQKEAKRVEKWRALGGGRENGVSTPPRSADPTVGAKSESVPSSSLSTAPVTDAGRAASPPVASAAVDVVVVPLSTAPRSHLSRSSSESGSTTSSKDSRGGKRRSSRARGKVKARPNVEDSRKGGKKAESRERSEATSSPPLETGTSTAAQGNRTAGVVQTTLPQVRQEIGVSARDFVNFIAGSVGNLQTYSTMQSELHMSAAEVKHVPLQPGGARGEKRSVGGRSASGKPDGGKRRRTQQRPLFEDVPQCPTYYPTALEFAEPLEYIASIREEAEKFGICRIVPPPQWQPKCQVSESSAFLFQTRLQHVHRLFKRNGPNGHYLDCLREHLRTEGTSLVELPEIGGVKIDLYWLSILVEAHGGLQTVVNQKLWGAVANNLKVPRAPERDARIQACYYQFLLSYQTLSPEEKKAVEGRVIQARMRGPPEDFGYGDGPSHTMASFRKYADSFKRRWFGKDDVRNEDIEREYWSIVDQADRHVGVCYGSDIDTTKHGSGFATDLDDPYSRFGWNLNVLPGLEGSILKHVSGISGISMPWLYVGMMFSTFAWHNEDNYLYSINYHHFGAPKQWYGVSGSGAGALEASFRSQMPDEFERRPLLLHDLVTMVSPEILRQDGVPVCQTVQEAGQFVVTFPQSYHGGFSYGFNCGEAVNFASADWIPHGRRAIYDYAKQRRPVSLNQEHLILSTARLEHNPTTLSYVVDELVAMRKRESTARSALVERGVRQTTFEVFSGGQSRDLGSGNIFQQRHGAKMSAGRMAGGRGVFDALSPSEGAAAAEAGSAAPADISTLNTKGSTLTSPVCEVCSHVCHMSMVSISGRAAFSGDGSRRVRCVQCALEDAALGTQSIGWTSDPRGADSLLLVCRYSLDELDELAKTAKKRMGVAVSNTPAAAAAAAAAP